MPTAWPAFWARRGWRQPALYVGGRHGHGDLPAADVGCVRQECAVSAARVAARRDGRPHAGQRLDSRGHDGHGRRLHGGRAARRCSPCRPTPSTWWRSSACITAAAGRGDRDHANRSEARAGLFHDQPAGLHVPGAGRRHAGGHRGRHVPPVHARVLQGPAVPGRRQRDARHGRRDRHAPLRRPAAADADHALDVFVRLPGPGRRRSLRRLLEQGRHPGRGARKRARGRFVQRAVLGRFVHRLLDRVLHVPRVLPHVLRRPSACRTRRGIMPTSRRRR